MSKRVRETMVVLLVVVMFMAMLCACGYVETHYTREDCVVVEVENNLITVEDKCGYLWCYYMDSEDYTDVPSVGTVVDLRMHTAHTDYTIEDDEILRVVVH